MNYTMLLNMGIHMIGVLHEKLDLCYKNYSCVNRKNNIHKQNNFLPFAIMLHVSMVKLTNQ